MLADSEASLNRPARSSQKERPPGPLTPRQRPISVPLCTSPTLNVRPRLMFAATPNGYTLCKASQTTVPLEPKALKDVKRCVRRSLSHIATRPPAWLPPAATTALPRTPAVRCIQKCPDALTPAAVPPRQPLQGRRGRRRPASPHTSCSTCTPDNIGVRPRSA